jgi:glucose-6-phosphate isomerase
MAWLQGSLNLGVYEGTLNRVLNDLIEQRVIPRLWDMDFTLWKTSPAEITNRLGWLWSPRQMVDESGRLLSFARQLPATGFSNALLLGMGGSSLAAEVFRKTFGVAEGFLDLSVVDTTVPEAVWTAWESVDPRKTLFIVSTKSGGTVETFSLLKFFYSRLRDLLGADEAGRRFVAITDPGSALASIAERHAFRTVFLSDPDIGGRYSALSFFGLVPAAMVGIDVRILAGHALAVSREESPSVAPQRGQITGAVLGAVLGELALRGRDKATFAFSPAIAPFGEWVEQLLAESTGKEGKGILPVIGETISRPSVYGNDRVFIWMGLEDEGPALDRLAALEKAGHPVVKLRLDDVYDLAGLCFFWEVAAAVAAWRLGVNPFDQPDVEAAKVLARQRMTDAGNGRMVADPPPVISHEGMGIYGDIQGRTIEEALSSFLSEASPGSYITMQAYLAPRIQTEHILRRIQSALSSRYRVAVTLGWGPRYLHSTGQLHKGDGGHGLFIQFTCDDRVDLSIPDDLESHHSSVSFGTLKTAQVLGDFDALQRKGRRVIRVHLGHDANMGLERFEQLIQGGTGSSSHRLS